MPNGFTIGTSGGNKAVNEITIGTSGGNKSVTEYWTGTASGNKLVHPRIEISSVSVNDSVSGSPASAEYKLTAGGDIQDITIGFGTVDIGDWISHKAVVSGSYEVRATIVSGTVIGTTGSWLALSSDRSWAKNRVMVGNSTAVLTVELRHSANPSDILSTATITLFAERT